MAQWPRQMGMNILLTNDDGVHSPGLTALADALRAVGRVTVVAPAGERSGVGHAITWRRSVTAERVSLGDGQVGYAVSGTPADCVHFALTELLEARPDVVVSGINLGPNLGLDIFYSGTVAAAIEGAMSGILSMAFSTCQGNDQQLSLAAAEALRVLNMIVGDCRSRALAYNVNIPAIHGRRPEVRFTRHRTTKFVVWPEDEAGGSQEDCGSLEGEEGQLLQGDGGDVNAVEAGMISVTPLRASLTDMDSLRRLRQ